MIEGKDTQHQPPEYEDTTFVCASSWLYSAIYDCSTKEETDEMLQVILRASQGDYNYKPANNRAFARTVQAVIKRNNEKREKQQQQRIAAGRSSAQKRAENKLNLVENSTFAESIDNQEDAQRSSTLVNVNVNVNENVNENNTPQQAPLEGLLGAGGGGFFEYFGFYKRALKYVAGLGVEMNEKRCSWFAWACTDHAEESPFQPLPSVAAMIVETAGNGPSESSWQSLQMEIERRINNGVVRPMDKTSWYLCAAVDKLSLSEDELRKLYQVAPTKKDMRKLSKIFNVIERERNGKNPILHPLNFALKSMENPNWDSGLSTMQSQNF